eukprot:CAMPEP_0115034404 /NCGR_PEP_ID=MMETSP0216-20121206/40626_1 /TAXON_ID=223996 /ORGANISM="Protocruzia adherens, Strain Boccale" /LENGTH=313 /DNA_ID=CAMNT_0002413273 /DNA_START=247 /DNA_END=1184 /DNA_ORIENTATION=-
MRAGIYDLSAPSGFSVREDHPVPKYGPKDVVLKVITAAINPIDYKVVVPAIPFLRHFKSHVAGRAVAGVVIAVGNKVKDIQVGENVYGNSDSGSLAEYSVSSAGILGRCPTNMTWQQVAGVPVSGLTGYQVFKKNGLKFGDRTLVIGASGGSGLSGVQIAKAMGAYVIGICSARNIELVKSVGADEVVDYTEPEFYKRIEPESLDFIYDTVSSPQDPNQEPWARPLLKLNATSPYSKINSSPGDWVKVMLGRALHVNLQRKGIDVHPVEPNSKDFNELTQLIEKADITVPIDCEKGLDNEGIREGYDRQRSRR